MRSKAVVMGLVLAGGLIGCKQQVFMTKEDYHSYDRLAIAQPLETGPENGYVRAAGTGTAPATVLCLDRPIRYMCLSEAIAIALEQGNIGNTSVLFSAGFNIDNLISFSSTGAFGDDNVRVLALDPAIQATDIETALSKFDTMWVTSMTWNHTDQGVGNVTDSFQASNSNVNAININNAAFTSGLIKPLPTGGVAGITFQTTYQLSNLNQRVNPAYRPQLEFEFEQPLLRGAGVAINQLTQTPPDRVSNTISPFRRFFFDRQTEGILVTRVRFNQTRIDFERNIQFQLLNVEAAYWNLYGSYWTLYSREQGLRQAFEAWKINRLRYEAGRIPIQDFAQSRQQYETFRSQRIAALGDVLEKERQLRGLLGMSTEDGVRLVPCDEPTLAPFQPDWCNALREAIELLPGLNLARQEVKAQHLILLREQNRLLPDLRFLADYNINGIGSTLDGSGQNNAFRSLAQNRFNTWDLGLRMDVPIGFRNAHASVRIARLNLLRSYNVLRDQELKAERFLALEYRRLFEYQEQIKAQRSLREAAATQLDARFKEFLAGRGTLDFLLESQRVWADALRSEYDFIVQYNTALAGFQFAKGTILQYNNVHIGEGALPHCAQVRAVEHQRERMDSLKLFERAVPLYQPKLCTGDGLHIEAVGPPAIPSDHAAPLSEVINGKSDDLLKDKPMLPPVPSTGPSYVPPTVPPGSVLPFQPTQSPLPPTVQGPREPMPAIEPVAYRPQAGH